MESLGQEATGQILREKSFTEVTSPKSRISTNSIMPADMSGRATCRYFIALCFYTAREPRRSITLDLRL